MPWEGRAVGIMSDMRFGLGALHFPFLPLQPVFLLFFFFFFFLLIFNSHYYYYYSESLEIKNLL